MIELDKTEISTGNGLHSALEGEERQCVLLVEDDPALRRYLEVRVPFLNREMIEMTARMPPRL